MQILIFILPVNSYKYIYIFFFFIFFLDYSQWITEERDSKFIFFLFILVFYGCGYRCTNRPYSFSKIVILLRKELIAGTLEIYERTVQVFREEFYEESQSNNGITNNNCCSVVL